MVMSRKAATEPSKQVAPRRRGPVLERAILTAALEQLSTVGWRGLTMEGVASAAQTGKAAVYRRWPSKQALATDALQAALPAVPDVPDLGSLREDLLFLVLRMREAMYSQSGLALRAVIDESDQETAHCFVRLVVEGVVEPTKHRILDVVRRGVGRGEVRPDATGDIVADVVPALMMYRSKMGGREISEHDLVEVVDQVMLPLLRP
ncbi:MULTISPECIES: TetR/AcrR family transcriptional regulator [unclassified Streptomyces]|uniref:TetR/AcrR family transcriptional regulator n=1 Tax=unclassified Streptomyces TaxID=2593676 RepID=UPI0038000FCE